jgi:hypothetical protein
MMQDPDYHAPVLSKLCRCIERLSPLLRSTLVTWMTGCVALHHAHLSIKQCARRRVAVAS